MERNHLHNFDQMNECSFWRKFIRRPKVGHMRNTVIKKSIDHTIPISEDSSGSVVEREMKHGIWADVEKEQIYAVRGVKEATPPSVLSKKIGFDGCGSARYGSVEEYEFTGKIGSGSYGMVHKAMENNTGEMVAIKELFGGFSKSSCREIDILNSVLRHPSFVEFKQVIMDENDGVYIVMEYVANDLRRAMKSMKDRFNMTRVKSLVKQLLEGIHFLHENGIMHRDLKPSNILLSEEGQLKICDFGLSRHFEKTFDSYSPRVATLWYKAPELLLGAEKYSCAVDMWAVGCILAELLLGEVIFKGKSEIDQLKKIYDVLGTPNDTIFPGFSNLPGSKLNLEEQPLNLLGRNFPILSQVEVHLLSKLLSYNAEERMTAKDALDHHWFKEIVD